MAFGVALSFDGSVTLGFFRCRFFGLANGSSSALLGMTWLPCVRYVSNEMPTSFVSACGSFQRLDSDGVGASCVAGIVG